MTSTIGPPVIASSRVYPCETCPIRKLPVFRQFTETELAFVSRFKAGELQVETGATILREGTSSAHLYTVLSGWAFRYKMLSDGRRQILNFALPGDFIGLQASVFDEMNHSVEALTEVLLCVFPRDRLWELFENHASLSFDMSWLAAREESILDQHLLNVGRRSAIERTAFLLLHLFARARELNLGTKSGFPAPITQQHLADTLGMSLVHTNKTLKRLTQRKLLRWEKKQIGFPDLPALQALAHWEEDSVGGVRPLI
jgi:CRP-like cAMP-binding protein